MATAPQTGMEMPQEGMNPYANPDTAAIYDQMRQTVSPKEFSDEVLAGASQVDPEEVAKFKAELEQLDVPMEVLDMLNNMVDEILANPDNYEQVKQKYEAMGVTDDLLPDAFDGEFFSALNMAVDQMIAEPAGAQAFAKGGIAELSPISKAVASYGRNGDTMLAHITPAEARMLRRRGGAGTTNPDTGLKEYFSLKKLFKGIGNAVKSFASSTVGKIVTTVALGFFLGPAAASLVGATSAAGVAAVSGFVGGAGSTLLGGGNLKDALKAGAIGGLTAGAGAGVMGGSEAFQAGSYTGPTTVGGQVDKVTGMFKSAPFPEYTAQGALTDNATSNAAREAYAGELYKTNPEAFYNPAPTPTAPLPGQPGSDVMVGGKPAIPPLNANPMDATEIQGSLAKPPGVAPPTNPSFLDRAKTFYNENISPSGIQQQGAGKALETVQAQFPGVTTEQILNAPATSVLGKAYATAMPGILSTYGPMAAVGIGALGAAGGFKPTPASQSSLKPELMKPVTQRIAEGGNQRNYYVQGLPGVKYDQYGAPIFGQNMPLPTFETGLGITSLMNPKGYAGGGSVSEADKEAAKRAFELANPNGLGPSVNIGGYGTLNFQNDAAYDQFNQNPQSMTFSQGPGGVRYVEPQAMDYGGIGSLGGGMGGKPGFDELGNATMAFAGGGLAGVSDVAKRVVDANNFDETAYLNANPDVKAAIAKGEFANAYEHYSKFGQTEGRTAFDKTETAAKAATDAEAKAAAQAANRKAVADAKTAKKAAGFTNAYQNINAGLSYDAPAGIAATAIAARQAAFKPTMDKFTQAQATNAATLAKPYTPTVVDQPYNNTKGYTNVLNPVAPKINYDTTPVGTTPVGTTQPPVTVTTPVEDRPITTMPVEVPAYTGRAITDQEVKDYLISNPNATDQDLVKIMDYYKVNPDQVARVTGMQDVSGGSVQNIDRRYEMAKAANAGNPFAVAAQNQANAVTGQSIRDYFAKNPGMTDAQIAGYMDKNFIDPAQMQYAFAGTPGAIGSHDVLARYQAATKLPAMVAGSPQEQAAVADGQALLQRTLAAQQPPITQTKLLNMGGIASLGSGGYPRRTGQISGPGTATSDSIPAMLSDGEFVMTAKAVRGAGKGDRRAGAKRMYALMNQLEKNAARG